MSSRHQEKERRRREREAQEAKAAAAAGRTRRLQLVGGVVVALAVVVVAVVLLTSGGDDDGGASTAPQTAAVTLPPREVENLEEAAEAAECTISAPEVEGATHTEEAVEYDTNPPTSGDHNPVPAQDGVYEHDATPAKEHLVHSLEHGRIHFQYRPDAPPETIATLEAIFNEEVNGTPGYHALVYQNTTDMEPTVVATAWGQMIACEELGPEAIDALRAFRERYTDKGPEFVP